MLLAEDFVLLALDPEGTNAHGASNQPAVATGVTGALLSELALDGHLDLTDGRIHLTGSTPTHPLLVQALENTAPYEGKKLKSKLSSIKHAGWTEVVDGMVEAGVLGREKSALRPTRHPPVDSAAHTALIAEVQAAAAGDGPLDERMAVLLALAGPCQLLEIVAPARSARKHARHRIDHAAEHVPAAAAVKATIEAVAAATTATIVAASAASST